MTNDIQRLRTNNNKQRLMTNNNQRQTTTNNKHHATKITINDKGQRANNKTTSNNKKTNKKQYTKTNDIQRQTTTHNDKQQKTTIDIQWQKSSPSPWDRFFDFPFRSYSCFHKKIWLTRQKVFPLLTASNSPSALSAQALHFWNYLNIWAYPAVLFQFFLKLGN